MSKRKGILFAFVSAGLFANLSIAQFHTVAMTVDDLPFASGLYRPLSSADDQSALHTNEKIIRAFTRHHIPATGFVIERNVEELGNRSGRKILSHWIRPGFDLGNHLYSHADVNSLTAEQAELEITRGESSISPLLATVGRRPKFLRFPFNHTGNNQEKHDAIASFMSARGYRLAPCTIDNSDYVFNSAYVVALARHDNEAAAKIRESYIAYTGSEIDWYIALDRQVFKYDPPHIMLLHDSPLNADTIEALLSLFEYRGYRFVTLEEALKDPAYAVPETYITKFGPMWGYRWARELGVKVDGKDEPDPPSWIEHYVEDHRGTQQLINEP